MKMEKIKKTVIFKIFVLLTAIQVFMPCAFAQDGAVGRITYTDGRVDILKEGSSLSVPVREGDEVSINDALRTKSNSKAEVRFDDGSRLRLGENSRVEITDYQLDSQTRRKTAAIKLDRGKMRAIISKTKTSEGEFNIFTPNANGTVTGSDIFAFYQAGSSGMLVAEGRLAVKSLLAPEKPLVVPAGSSAIIDIGGVTAGPRPYMAIERKVYEHDTAVPYTLPKKTEAADIKGAFVKITGDVKVAKKGAAPREADYSDVIGEGDRIETGANGTAEIKFDNGCGLSLKPDTHITITRLVIDPKTREYQNLFESSRGRIKARIENLKDKSVFEIKTPAAICGARGTIMYVDILPTMVKAFFEGGGGYIQNLISGSETLLDMGYSSSSDSQGSTSAPALVTDEERDNWTQGWGGEGGAEGYSAPPAGGTTGDLGGGGAGGPTGDLGGGAGGGGLFGEPPDSVPFTEAHSQSNPTPPVYSLNGDISGMFGSYREQERKLDLSRGSLSGSFSVPGSAPIWGGSRTLTLIGTYLDSSSPYDKLWGGTFSGTTSDGASLLGVAGGIKGSLEGLLYAFYIRPDGGGYRAGYIKSSDMIGNFFPGAGTFSAAGTITSHFDFATNILPGSLYIGSPDIRWFGTPEGAGTGLVSGDGFTGTIFLDTAQINQQPDTDLWMAGLGGIYTDAPQGAWNAVLGGVDHWEDADSYWIMHLTGEAWQNNKFRGRAVSGRDIGYSTIPEHRYDADYGSWTTEFVEGHLLGVYEQNGGWQAIGMGVFPPSEDLRFGAKFDGKFGHYDTELQKVDINYGSFTGILGGTGLPWNGSQRLTIIGEFLNTENNPLWHNLGDINGTTSDGGVFLASMGGIKGSLKGALYAFYIRPDGQGGNLAGYLKSTDITGEFYPGIGMFEADGNMERSVNEYGTQYLPSQLYDGGPALDEGSVFGGRIGGAGFAANLTGESTRIEDQSWGLWRGGFGGAYQAAPAGPWTADIGGSSFGYVGGPVESYFLGNISGGAWQNGELNGYVSLSSLGGSSFGAGSGEHIGVYSNGIWQGLTIGSYTDEILLSSSGRFVAQGWNIGAGSSFDFAGLIGLIGPIWSAGANPDFISMGEFTPPDANNPDKQFAWIVQKEWFYPGGGLAGQDGFVSRYSDDQRPPAYTYTTYNDASGVGNGVGAFYGLAAGIGGDGLLRGLIYSIYVDPLGGAGVLWGEVAGDYYADIEMYRMNSLPEGLDKNLYVLNNIGIAPENLRANISWDNLNGSPDGGAFGDGESEAGPNISAFSGTMLNIGQQPWGVWNFAAHGTYDGPTSDTWDVYDMTGLSTSKDANYIGGAWLGGIYGDPSDTTITSKWSDGKIDGAVDALWIALHKNGTLSGRRVDGEIVGNYVEVDVNTGTWQAGAAGEWIEVNANLASAPGLDANVIALGQAANIPISVAYSSILSGSAGPITSMTMDTHLFNMVGGGDGIWAGIINGSYSTPPSTNWNVTVTNGPDNATLSGPAWANNQWNADVAGTVNGNSITGNAGGTYADGQFQGAGTGTFERQ